MAMNIRARIHKMLGIFNNKVNSFKWGRPHILNIHSAIAEFVHGLAMGIVVGIFVALVVSRLI